MSSRGLRKRGLARALEWAEHERHLFMALQLTYGPPTDRVMAPQSFVQAVICLRGIGQEFQGLWRRYYAWHQEKQRE